MNLTTGSWMIFFLNHALIVYQNEHSYDLRMKIQNIIYLRAFSSNTFSLGSKIKKSMGVKR